MTLARQYLSSSKTVLRTSLLALLALACLSLSGCAETVKHDCGNFRLQVSLLAIIALFAFLALLRQLNKSWDRERELTLQLHAYINTVNSLREAWPGGWKDEGVQS